MIYKTEITIKIIQEINLILFTYEPYSLEMNKMEGTLRK